MDNNPVKRGGNANLKPLDPDTHRTNRWNFSGKNLSNIELKRLASRGVTDNDWMPDNRLKHPRLRRRGGNKTLMSASVDMEELEQKQEERWQEYLAVPEPKIDYFDWAALRERRQAFDMLEKVLLNAGRTSDRLKAIAIHLDATKPKPKQLIETSDSTEQFMNMTPMQVLYMALESCGIRPEKFKEFLESNPDISIQ